MAKVIRAGEVALRPVQTAGARGALIAELITEMEGAPTFAMRLFELAPGGSTPLHTHAWEHEVYILEGQCRVQGPDGGHDMRAGDAILAPGGEEHCFVNSGRERLRFLCMIPTESGGCR